MSHRGSGSRARIAVHIKPQRLAAFSLATLLQIYPGAPPCVLRLPIARGTLVAEGRKLHRSIARESASHSARGATCRGLRTVTRPNPAAEIPEVADPRWVSAIGCGDPGPDWLSGAEHRCAWPWRTEAFVRVASMRWSPRATQQRASARLAPPSPLSLSCSPLALVAGGCVSLTRRESGYGLQRCQHVRPPAPEATAGVGRAPRSQHASRTPRRLALAMGWGRSPAASCAWLLGAPQKCVDPEWR